jgi:hypothetical protein
MNKKLMIGGLLVVFMLVSISFVSSAEMNADAERKESPLYRIRTRQATMNIINDIVDNIKTSFLGERIFFVPFTFLIINNRYPDSGIAPTWDDANTCFNSRCKPTAGMHIDTVCGWGDCTYRGDCWTDFGLICKFVG